jgi:hypothetical protein
VPGVEGGGATTISNEPSARERISISKQSGPACRKVR